MGALSHSRSRSGMLLVRCTLILVLVALAMQCAHGDAPTDAAGDIESDLPLSADAAPASLPASPLSSPAAAAAVDASAHAELDAFVRSRQHLPGGGDLLEAQVEAFRKRTNSGKIYLRQQQEQEREMQEQEQERQESAPRQHGLSVAATHAEALSAAVPPSPSSRSAARRASGSPDRSISRAATASLSGSSSDSSSIVAPELLPLPRFQSRATLPRRSGRSGAAVSAAPTAHPRVVGNGSTVIGNPDPWNFLVVVAPGAPMVFEDSTKTGNARYSGLMVDLFDEVMSRINLLGASYTYTLFTSPYGSSIGSCRETGNVTASGAPAYSCSGLVRVVHEGLADIALGAATLTSSRNSAVSFPFGLLQVGKRVLVKKKAPLVRPLSFLDPFSKNLWLALLGVACWLTLAFYVVDRLSYYGYRALPKSDDSHSNLNLGRSFVSSFGVLIGGDFDPGRSYSIKLMQLVYLFFVLIISATYTANLAAFLTNKSPVLLVSSFEDLKTNPNPFCVVRDSSTHQWFQNNPDISGMLISATIAATPEACIELLDADTVYAFVHSSPVIEYILTQPPCSSLNVGDMVGPGEMGLPLLGTSTMKHAFNQVILEMVELGVVDGIIETFYRRVTQCPAEGAEESETPVIDVEDISGLFWMMLVLPALGLAVCGLEFAVHKWGIYEARKKKEREAKEAAAITPGEVEPAAAAVAGAPSSRSLSYRIWQQFHECLGGAREQDAEAEGEADPSEDGGAEGDDDAEDAQLPLQHSAGGGARRRGRGRRHQTTSAHTVAARSTAMIPQVRKSSVSVSQSVTASRVQGGTNAAAIEMTSMPAHASSSSAAAAPAVSSSDVSVRFHSHDSEDDEHGAPQPPPLQLHPAGPAATPLGPSSPSAL